MATDLKELIRQYVEQVWNLGNPAALDQLTTPSFTYLLAGQPGRDRAGMQQFIKMTHVAFPDWRVQIVDIIAEGSSVVIRWQGRVTHQGVFQGILPTGKQITVSGINIYRIAGDKISAEWEQTDSLAMLQQLGVLPRPGA
ncbi:MAG: ester cyclase [Anaerolineaceae bacterium]|nr:ester cyclase [Anaerolineaceae bacterium]